MKDLMLSLWKNHRKKILTFIAAVLIAAISYVSGVPINEIKDAVNAAPSIGLEAAPEKAPAPAAE